MEVVFGMLFLILSNVNVKFLGRKLCLKTYTTEEAFPITRHMKLVGKKEFIVIVLDLKHETYVVYIRLVSSVALPNFFPLNIPLFRRPQIVSLIAKEALTKIFDKYVDFADVFSPDLASKLLGINNHAIKLVDSQ